MLSNGDNPQPNEAYMPPTDDQISFIAERPLDRAHRWALGGTAVAQGALLVSAGASVHVVAELMSGYLLVIGCAVGLVSLVERGWNLELAAALGSVLAVGYAGFAGHWTSWAPQIWVGLTCLAIVVTTENGAGNAARAAGIFAAVAAIAFAETHRPEVFIWAAAAAVPAAVAQWWFGRQPNAAQAGRMAFEALPAE